MKLALLLILLAACPKPGTMTTSPTPESAPRLVVVLVIDQLPEWAFEAKRPELGRGFARLLREGDWQVGRHPSAATLTAPGHALIGTGAPPARSGILANEWWSREHDRLIKAVQGDDGGVSTKWLRVSGLGDAIAAANTGAKAVGIALKDRAARLPLGHRGLAVYYKTKTASWQSHGDAGGGAPTWLDAHNRDNPVANRLAAWTPLDPARLAKLSGVADAEPGEVGEKGFGPTFPHDPATTTLPADAVFAMPVGNDMIFDAATAAIDGERLGADRTPDLLLLSLSAHDYVAHGWGHESWEAWDMALRLDVRLEQFLAELDRKVGAGRWAMVVTSDHGGSPLPERIGGGRYTFEHIQRTANEAATQALGPGDWIASASYPNIYFTKAALAKPKPDLETAKSKVVSALRALPGLAKVDRVDAFAGRCDTVKGDDLALCLTFDRERSGELFYMPARGWVMEEEGERLATAHGSLNDYDRLVPVLLLPFGRTSHAPATAPSGKLELTSIAPLVARWLGVADPATLPR